MHLRLLPPRLAAAPALVVLALCSVRASASAPPADPSPPAFSIAFLGLVSQPFGPHTRGVGGGAALGYRLTDQLSMAAEAARVFTPAGPFSTYAAGLRAVLDSTPVSPYLAFSLVTLPGVAGGGLATRTAAGAEVRVTRAVSLGLEARALTALSGRTATPLPGGTEVALRMVLFPSLLR